MQEYYVVPEALHNDLVRKAYLHRKYEEQEAELALRMCLAAAVHGVRTHNAIKALTYEAKGRAIGACVPGAKITLGQSFPAVQSWDAEKKLGQAVAYEAMDACMKAADKCGVGIVAVDNCYHYAWGGAYVLYAAEKGYIAYTCCTAAPAEVVPFKGTVPALGTNPHSWGFPTAGAIGYPLIIDWATSVTSRGAVEACKREGRLLPPGAALTAQGEPTTDPNKADLLLPFGEHKGFSLSLIDELYAAYMGGSLPTLRGLSSKDGKYTNSFLFQAIRPDAFDAKTFAGGCSQTENVKRVLEDIVRPGNEKVRLPGKGLADAKKISQKYQGLLFTKAEILSFAQIALECREKPWKLEDFKVVEEL